MTRKANRPFEVIITRSATETVTLRVDAQSQHAAEMAVGGFLNQPHRVTVDQLKSRGYHVISEDCVGDEESSWEVA